MKLYYNLMLNTARVNFRLLINGIDVDSEMFDRNIATQFPINQWLIPGQNIISAVFFPNEETGKLHSRARVSAEIFVRDLESIDNKTTSIVLLETPEVNEDPDAPLELFFSAFFTVAQIFNTVLMQKEKNSPDLKNVSQLILKEYQKIQSNIERRDINALMELCKVKTEELSRLMFINEEEYKKEMQTFFEEGIMSPYNKFYPVKPQGLNFRGVGNIFYAVNEFEKSPIMVYNEAEDVTTYFEFMFYYDGEKMIVVR